MSDAARTSQWLRTMTVVAGGEAVEHYELREPAELLDLRFGAEVERFSGLKLQITIGDRNVFPAPVALASLDALRGSLLERMNRGQRFTVKLINSGRANIEARPFAIYNVASRGLAFPEVTP